MAKTRKTLSDSVASSVEADAKSGELLKADRRIAQLEQELAAAKGKYDAALRAIESANARADQNAELIGMRPRKIPNKKHKTSSATAVLVLSDWHIEETVDPETVNWLNRYDLNVAHNRVHEVFRRAKLLLDHERALVDIDHLVIAVLGDLISGHIHEELQETCSLSPMAASREAGELLLGGIEGMSDCFPKITVLTCHGNHGRSTHKMRVATSADHSYEHNLYKWLEKSTKHIKGLQWQVAQGYLNYLDVQGYLLRFHHGDAIRYGGGVGGLTIPMNKAKANWDRSKPSDLDICGHFHTHLYHPYKFVVNGCLIGMNPFGLKIRAEYQPPSQTLMVVDSRHGVTKVIQVFADEDVRRLPGGQCA